MYKAQEFFKGTIFIQTAFDPTSHKSITWRHKFLKLLSEMKEDENTLNVRYFKSQKTFVQTTKVFLL